MITILIPTLKAPAQAALLAVALVLVGCSSRPPPVAEGVRIVATTSIWGDVASNVVGDHGTVEVLIPVGADAHDYRLSPGQLAAVSEADLVVANGLGLEHGLADVLESARRDGADVIELAELVQPIPLIGGDPDPHVWHDPTRVAEAAHILARELSDIDATVDWQSQADIYAEDLVALTEEIESILSRIRPEDRELVTGHESLGYFAARHGLTVVGVIIPGGSTLAEPSSAEISEIVKIIETEDVPSIFSESGTVFEVAQAIAAESGDVEVVEVYTESLGPPGSGADTLIGMLATNAGRVAGGLSRP